MIAIAEVIASSSSLFTAEVYRDSPVPTLGQWVHVAPAENLEAYGIVSFVEMVPFDDGRNAVALGRSADELRREMPHVLELLRTVISVQMVAFRRNVDATVRQTLPPLPPRIHTPVHLCNGEELQQIAPPYDFLRVLLKSSEKPALLDDLLVAVLSGLSATPWNGSQESLVEAGKMLSRLMKDDSDRLQSILRRVTL